jgi:proline iminopeptidase
MLQSLGYDIADFNFEDELKLIKASTYLIYGDYDPLTFEVAKKLNKEIKKSEIYIFKNCGHFPFIESEMQFLETVDKILMQK